MNPDGSPVAPGIGAGTSVGRNVAWHYTTVRRRENGAIPSGIAPYDHLIFVIAVPPLGGAAIQGVGRARWIATLPKSGSQ
jgi:hypothetical protein